MFLVFHNLVLKFVYFCFVSIKSDKWVNTTNSFNKQVVLRLRNLDPFNKRVSLMLTHIVEYLLVDTTRIRHANTNYHP